MKTFDKIALGATTLGLVGAGAVFAASDTELSIQIQDGFTTVDIVDAAGVTVENPSASLGSINFSFDDQTVNGTLGTADQKIRLSNPTSDPSWGIIIAPTGDYATAEWSDGNGNTMSFKDPAGGQLTIDPSTLVFTDEDGNPITELTGTGLSKGTPFSFSDSTTSITLATSSVSGTPFTFFDITDISLAQLVPGKTLPAEYKLNLSLTLI